MDPSPSCAKAKARILSYNFNILPRGSGGYQNERIDAFLDTVENYDILLLQEVYSTSLFPYALQKRLCCKKLLLDGLKERGFKYYVISRQPSYYTMLNHRIISDNGLLIASRFPIWQRGTYTFRSRERRDQSMAKGCIFAEVEIPSPDDECGQRLVFFNTHLRAEDGNLADSYQFNQLKRSIEIVMNHLRKKAQKEENDSAIVSWLPFVVAGDFNVLGIESTSHQPSKKFFDMISEFQSFGGVRDVIFDSQGKNLPTRPPRLFFPTVSRLERYEAVPQRQDYFLISPSIDYSNVKLDKFVAGNRRPYSYLSDHFGISVTVEVPVSERTPPNGKSSAPLKISSLFEEADHERSNPTSSLRTEVLFFAFTAWTLMFLKFSYVLFFGALWIVLHFLRYGIVNLPDEHYVAPITEMVREGKAVALPKDFYNAPVEFKTVAELWERSVNRFRVMPCLGLCNERSQAEWLTFGMVDAQVRDLGRGLFKMGLVPGDIIGVQSEADVNVVLLELACAIYGYTTMALMGKGSLIRTLLDESKIKVVFASSNAISGFLSCRSTSLETVVGVNNSFDDEAVMLAKDLNIQLISIEAVEREGRISNITPPTFKITPSTVFTYNLDNASSDNCLSPIPMTHAEVVNQIKILFSTKIVSNFRKREIMVWYVPFAAMYQRLFIFTMLSQGSSVACSSSMILQEVFQMFKPTIFIASPSLFKMSEIQLKRALQRYSVIYNWLFARVYTLRSHLIHVKGKDSAILRFLFFRLFNAQLGGHVRKIVLCSSQETTQFDLLEHISLCYVPIVREITYQNRVGICTVDGIPAPNLKVRLNAIDAYCSKVGIGEIAVCHSEGSEEIPVEVAAVWEDGRHLVLLGSSQGILWPVSFQYTVAVQLERLFIHSRFIVNIFVYCEPNMPMIAIVHPDRDTLEYELRLDTNDESSAKHLSWKDLSENGPPLILKDLKVIAEQQNLDSSQIPVKVHLHPHAFRNYATFFTPFNRLRREKVRKHFSNIIDKMYNKSLSDSFAEVTNLDALSDSEYSVKSVPVSFPSYSNMLRVPVTIDIGGTFAKMVYVTPPVENFSLPASFIKEPSSLSETLNLRTTRFFADAPAAQIDEEKRATKSPTSATIGNVGLLKFGKIPSHDVPMLVEHLSKANVVSCYKKEYMERVRATGGGAFKYAPLVKNALGVSLEVVKEMDAVVRGLNMIIKLAPDSIFTVDPSSGKHLPHQLASIGDTFSPFPYLLINIGSGISFIKCLNAEGDHIRVGGSPIGGATFWGLTKSLTNLTSWEEVMEIMRLDGPGDNKNVDLLVGDIYGFNAKDLPAMLSSETVASSFGKLGVDPLGESGLTPASRDVNSDFNSVKFLTPLSSEVDLTVPKKTSNDSVSGDGSTSSMDIVRSLLNMISGNVTQLAYLHGKTHGVKNIFFAGGFVRDNPFVWNFISSTLLYWSSGECKAHFLQHDGYLGALGCAVLDTEDGRV